MPQLVQGIVCKQGTMEYNCHCPKVYIGADVQYDLVIKNFAQLE